jgi:hypothetical protein
MKEFLKSLGWKQWLCLVGIAWGLLLLWSSTTYQGARVYCAVNPCYRSLGSTCKVRSFWDTQTGGKFMRTACKIVTGPDSFDLR